MVAEGEGFLEERVADRRLAQGEQQAALRRHVAARPARGPARRTVAAYDLAPGQLTQNTTHSLIEENDQG